jgi:hypothetical protein
MRNSTGQASPSGLPTATARYRCVAGLKAAPEIVHAMPTVFERSHQMSRCNTIIAAALAAAALAAPTALAQPPDIHAGLSEPAPEGQRTQDLRMPDTRDAARATTGDKVTPAVDAALARERYYASYGAPEPLAPPRSPVASDDTPWLPIALSIAVTLAIVAAGAAHLSRRGCAARATT